MENQIPSTLHRNSVISFLSTKRIKNIISILLMFAIFNLTTGCRYYYRVNSEYQHKTNLAVGVENLKTHNKYFIVHFNDSAFWLDSIAVSHDWTEITGKLETLPADRYSFERTKRGRPNRYTRHERHVLHEVHIYAQEYVKSEDLSVVIPLESIERIDIYNVHTGATLGSLVLGTIGLAAGLVVVAGLLLLLLFNLSGGYDMHVVDEEN